MLQGLRCHEKQKCLSVRILQTKEKGDREKDPRMRKEERDRVVRFPGIWYLRDSSLGARFGKSREAGSEGAHREATQVWEER